MKKRRTGHHQPSRTVSARKDFPIVMVGMLAFGILLLFGLWANRANLTAMFTLSEPATTNVAQGAGPSTSPATESRFQKLVGHWVRPDGGYVLEISGVDSSGKMQVAYLNPQPIHVARANAWQESGQTRLFIELQDVNYPGSTYTLSYQPATDQLQGIYFQGASKQQYEIFFTRSN